MSKGDESHTLVHIYYYGWPDKRPFPRGNREIDYLCQLYDQHIDKNGKGLVHCSAGIARTGTFLAHYLTWLIKQGRLINRTNRELVSLLRQQRVGLVQNESQYDSTVAYRRYLQI